jgi:hypothetical protein
VVAEDVLKPAVMEALADAFAAALARPFSDTPAPDRFCRITGYDGYSLPLTQATAPPFNFFISRAWHDVLAEVAGVQAVGAVRAALHHHRPGGAAGAVHNDLNPGWFAGGAANPAGVVVSDPDVCNYHHGRPARPSARPRRYVRAVAMIYYLANPSWEAGDGGETGLYRRDSDGELKLAAVTPPLNNSLLLFECTPVSFHAFQANRNARNSVILWLHRQADEAERRWGAREIVEWPR